MVEFSSTNPTSRRGTMHLGLDMMQLLERMIKCNAYGKTALVLDEEGNHNVYEIENSGVGHKFATYEEVKEFAIFID